jgi:hypothetical protein
MLLEDSLGFTLVLCKEKLCRRNCPKAIVLKKEKIFTSKEKIFYLLDSGLWDLFQWQQSKT